jgi:predicted dehydrogenase
MKTPDNGKGGLHRRFLVIGCGSIGTRHIKNLLELGITDILAFDLQPDRRSEVNSRFGIETVETLDAAWERRPDVAVITTPTALHVPIALHAAVRHCDLFIEKPLSNDWNSIEQLLAVVRQNCLMTLVGCNMRFHPGLMTVKKLLDRQAVGRVMSARVEFGQYLPDWHPSEDYRKSYSAQRHLGGGVILDVIHEIDYIRWLLGEVAGASCVAGKLSRLEIDTEDTAAILLGFQSGAIGEVHLDYIQRTYRRTCQVIGEEGSIHWDFSAGQVHWYLPNKKEPEVFDNPRGWSPDQMYLDEMKHYLRCLAREEKPQLDIFEAARVLQIALAAKESAREQRWVQLGSQNWNTQVTL